MNPPGDQPTEATAANGSLPSGVSTQPTRSKLSKGKKGMKYFLVKDLFNNETTIQLLKEV